MLDFCGSAVLEIGPFEEVLIGDILHNEFEHAENIIKEYEEQLNNSDAPDSFDTEMEMIGAKTARKVDLSGRNILRKYAKLVRRIH